MNKILSARPEFSDDHFIYRSPRWLEATYLGLLLLIAGLLAYLALSINSIPLPLTLMLWLASGILVLIALRRRHEAASIYFACDRGGVYFPSIRSRSIVVPTTDVSWLHVPWDNISDIRIQLFLNEAANTRGVVLSIVATDSEAREFLAHHAVLKDAIPRKSIPTESFPVGFSTFFHRHSEVMSILKRFQTATSATGNPIETNPERTLARDN
ncbi:MAG: hypothetical protein D4R84_14395 [Rhodocyclaceae bacterium]|nr:MAG: hypothetical protein D4R84_14395 [Rhodocyclaceae bacterium]